MLTIITFLLGCDGTESRSVVDIPVRDTLAIYASIDGVNQPTNDVLSNHWLDVIDIETLNPLTFTPKMNKTYRVKFYLDSIGGRPVVLSSKDKIEISQILEDTYDLTFQDTITNLMISIDYRKIPGFQMTKIYDKDTILLRKWIEVFRDVRLTISIEFNAE
ncbi:MAG: hypothetical protein JKX84_07660 [Flavobacteriales bacterium]|nr:hypothetical protein [Flavobacteriales bacterium]